METGTRSLYLERVDALWRLCATPLTLRSVFMLRGIETGVLLDKPSALEQEEEVQARIREPDVSYVWRRFHNGFFLALGDTVALTGGLLLAGILRLWLVGPEMVKASVWVGMLFPAWWIGAFLGGLLPGWGYGPAEELRRTTRLLFMVYGGLAVVLFVADQSQALGYLVLGLAFLLSLWTVPYARILVRRVLIAVEGWGIPVAVYGAGKMGRRIVPLLREEKSLGYDPVVVYDDDPEHWGEAIDDVQVLGSAELVTPHAQVAVMAMPEVSAERLRHLLEGPLNHYRSTVLIPTSFEVSSSWVHQCDLGGVLGLKVKHNLSSLQAQVLKRAIDLLLVGVTAPLWAPLCAVLAALILLEDSADPFFVQERVGTGGETINAIKFRTMVPNAEMVLRQRLEEDDDLRREWENSYKLENDPRITGIGSVLRRFSLDELPQLWNVLRGEMSLVGPRPLPTYHHETLTERARELRERVRPGLTGLWQISGRSDSGTDGMEMYDPYYVRNWSLWLDAVILVRTLRTVVKGTGAY